jgi:hypothetical protein
MAGTHRNGNNDRYKGNNYWSAFISINIISPFHRSPFMFRHSMIVIITPVGHAQKLDQVVRSVFIMTGIYIHYNNSRVKNNKRYYTHERDKFLWPKDATNLCGILVVQLCSLLISGSVYNEW